jgi:hypothetical protein
VWPARQKLLPCAKTGWEERAGRWRYKRVARRRAQRGQSLVEFALVLPVLLLVIFGTIEFSFIYQSLNTVHYAAREGARVGAILGPTTATADTQILAAIQVATSGGGGLLFSQILKIDIFKSDQNGTAPALAAGCAAAPNEDVYDGQGNPCGAANWPPSVRNATFNSQDYLGVRITFAYNWVTSFVSAAGGKLQLTSVSVQLIEPQNF